MNLTNPAGRIPGARRSLRLTTVFGAASLLTAAMTVAAAAGADAGTGTSAGTSTGTSTGTSASPNHGHRSGNVANVCGHASPGQARCFAEARTDVHGGTGVRGPAAKRFGAAATALPADLHSAYNLPTTGGANQTVSAACPQCHILLVEGDTPSSDDLGASVNEAVALGATEVSNSYGATETNGIADYGPTGWSTPNGLSAF